MRNSSARRVAPLTRMLPAAASACSRAARLGVSPTMLRSLAAPAPTICDPVLLVVEDAQCFAATTLELLTR